MIKELSIATFMTGAACAGDAYIPDLPSGDISQEINHHIIHLKNFGIQDVEAARKEGIAMATAGMLPNEALNNSIAEADKRYPGDLYFERAFVQECRNGYVSQHKVSD